MVLLNMSHGPFENYLKLQHISLGNIITNLFISKKLSLDYNMVKTYLDIWKINMACVLLAKRKKARNTQTPKPNKKIECVLSFSRFHCRNGRLVSMKGKLSIYKFIVQYHYRIYKKNQVKKKWREVTNVTYMMSLHCLQKVHVDLQ